MARTRQSDARSRRIGLILFAACMVVAVPTLIVLFSIAGKSSSPWFGQYDPDTHHAYNFSLTDQDGKTVRLVDLRGDAVLLAFGFTRCPNICPTTLGNLAAVYRKLPPAAQERTNVVFISVDERDTPASMKEYVPFFNDRFIGLTGAPAARCIFEPSENGPLMKSSSTPVGTMLNFAFTPWSAASLAKC